MAEDINSILSAQERRIRNMETKVTITKGTVPTGGDAGSFLKKTSSTDYDSAWVTGYVYYGTIKYDGSGTFVKKDYPNLRAIRVKCVGGGGGSGGAATCASGQVSFGGGGGGGAYTEKFILESQLAFSENVTVGAGGTAGLSDDGTGSRGGDGGDGGSSSFGSFINSYGGGGGIGDDASTSVYGAVSGAGGEAEGGDINIVGQSAMRGFTVSPSLATAFSSSGGSSHLGTGQPNYITSTGATGTAGKYYGGGATGGTNTYYVGVTSRAGAAGAVGIVLIDIFM